jgi:hypothetical protein
MIKFLGKFFSILAIVNMIAVPCFAADRVPAGTVLEEESYVFTIEETQALRQQLLELEAEVEKQKDLVEEYKELDLLSTKRFTLYDETIVLQNSQITRYQEWQTLDYNRIQQLERQRRADKLEKWGFFALGAGVVLGGVLVGDKIGDFAETN